MFIELTQQHIGKVLVAKDAITSVRERRAVLSGKKRKTVEVHCNTGAMFGSEVLIVTETVEEIKALLGEGEI